MTGVAAKCLTTRLQRLLIFACLTMSSHSHSFAAQAQARVAKWTLFEQEFEYSGKYQNPLTDVSLEVVFTSPTGQEKLVEGFWDGGNHWKVRVSPGETGKWNYEIRPGSTDTNKWTNNRGGFHCVPYEGINSLYTRGPLELSRNRRYLQQADGTPFFWLSDTAWNGPLKADQPSWETYLEDRQQKGYTAVQFVTTQWIAADGDADGRRAYSPTGTFSIDPEFFQRMDKRIAAINQHAMVAVPVLIWDVNPGNRSPSLDPGSSLSDDELTRLAKYEVARYGAYHVAWILAGDGEYLGEKADRWKKIGRAVFGNARNQIVTLHPAGQQWGSAELENEPWFTLISYQSGHGDSARDFEWLTSGPASKNWQGSRTLPIINLEPNYEGHLAYQSRKPFDAHAIRRAAYWSLLVTPTAGVAYGAHGVWGWQTTPGVPMNHETTGIAPAWYDAIHFPGSTDMKYLRNFFESLKWWTLRPSQELLVEQPGTRDPAQFVAAAQSEDERWAILYFPVGQKIQLNAEKLPKFAVVRWYDPSRGQWKNGAQARGNSGELTAPDEGDWIAWIGAASSGQHSESKP